MYEFGDDELKAIEEVVRSKKLFRFQGKGVETQCSLFEKELAEFHDSKYGLALTSGTNALVCALVAAGVGPKDEVLIPAFTFFATAAAVVQVGAIPVVINIDESLTMCTEQMEQMSSERTKAIIPVHMDGIVCNMDKILEFARKNKMVVIEDVAQAIGGHYKGRPLGSLGDIGCFSFNMEKNITAGEGGALITSNEKFYQKALCYHDTCVQFGWTHKDSFTKIDPFVGGSMRISEISGAMLRTQISKLSKVIDKLRERKNIWREVLDESNVLYREGHCKQGDCGSSLHLSFENPIDCSINAKKILKAGYAALPIQYRPAHAVWQWMHVLEEQRFHHPDMNPYLKTDKKYSYKKAQFISSIDILMSSLKIYIDYDLDLEQTRQSAQRFVEILGMKKPS